MNTEKRVPWSIENKPPAGERPSGSELARWLRDGLVTVDGVQLGPRSDVALPCQEIVFFKGKRKTTMPGFNREESE